MRARANLVIASEAKQPVSAISQPTEKQPIRVIRLNPCNLLYHDIKIF